MGPCEIQKGRIFEEIGRRLVKELDGSVKRNPADAILLSGGLDTSILAYLLSKRSKPTALTVVFEGAPASDLPYAELMARRLDLPHFVHTFGKDEFQEAVQFVVKVMDSFDPMEVRNSVAIYEGLRRARELGLNTVMTGDGCDELFAGYSFLYSLKLDELSSELQKVWSVMDFSSIHLAKALGMEAKLPYLDPEFKHFAMKLDPILKVGKKDGKLWGKWILRKAFEDVLPEDVVWRIKTPIECGSGTTILPKLFDSLVSDAEFYDKKKKYLKEDGIKLRTKEQMYYYEVYRKVVGVPRRTNLKGKVCPYCNFDLPPISTHCRRCGAYPV